jgi:signal transduction histidine kinase
MDQNDRSVLRDLGRKGKIPLGFRELLHELLLQANRNYSRTEVLRSICSSLLRFSGSDFLSIRIEEGGRICRCRAVVNEDGSHRIETYTPQCDEPDPELKLAGYELIPEPILHAILSGSFAAPTQSFTRGRSFWIGDTARPILLSEMIDDLPTNRTVIIGGEFPSLALVLIPVNEQSKGVLFLASHRRDFYSKDDIQIYEVVAQTLGVALNHQGTQWALRERIKELTCLYGIDKVASRPGIHLDDFLREIVEILPPGWQYPEITSARIVLDDHYFLTEGFKDSLYNQSAEIFVNDKYRGVVEIFYKEKMPEIDEGPFLKEERNLINAVAETIGRLVAHHEAQWALRERVKELTCLYGIAKIASRPGMLIEDFLKEIVKLLPPGWQYPGITQARIILDGLSVCTNNFQDSPYCQSADIVVENLKRGMVEVAYAKQMPTLDEGPFLKEERSLINEIARQIGLIVEHFETGQEADKLQEQLHHAERLATLGQLSAGVAHELNEPLAAILGFAQLAKESPNLPDQTNKDIEKIMNAALHAREVIRKLMIFTRQMPTKKVKCDLSNLIKEGLYFLESRCAKEGIVLLRELEENLPQVMADPSQLHQVLVNLVVNAIQAMPHGGKLTLKTHSDEGKVSFIVEDTGSGMNQEVQKQLFMPFFTTKDVGQGTGLGLPVVHGIVMAHGGTITVKSEVGKGSSFEVCLPIGNSVDSKEDS